MGNELDQVRCDRCGEIIEGALENPDLAHDDHEPWCTRPETGCDCAITAHAGCCLACEIDDWPNAETWVVHKMTTENDATCAAVMEACWVLRTARSSSVAGFRKVWQKIIEDANCLEEIEAAVAELGGSLETVAWKELLADWSDAAKELEQAGDLSTTRRPQKYEVIKIEPQQAHEEDDSIILADLMEIFA